MAEKKLEVLKPEEYRFIEGKDSARNLGTIARAQKKKNFFRAG